MLCSDNPHYFVFRGRNGVLIGSGEHYGAVLNLDFDFKKYLKQLGADGLNHTRTFSGAYCEPLGAFNIASNTLAPAASRYVTPWARSPVAGYANGGNKFDLDRWDPAYFARLKEFVNEAARRRVIVEMNLFCPFYGEEQWRLSPMNAANNVNQVGKVARTNVYTLDKSGGLLPVQDKMVQKIVSELNSFDNLYFEICNEPYFGGVTIEWQHHIADSIAATERSLPKQHLISQNIANHKAKVSSPHPMISILNFHYAAPPETVGMNYGLQRAIGDNETGFRGTKDLVYRSEAWEFILAGGSLFSHLDYSFTVGHEQGDFVYPASQPGGGTRELRRQFRILKNFIETFAGQASERQPFVRLKPDFALLAEPLPSVWSATVLGDASRAYAIYIGPKKFAKDGGMQARPEKVTLRLNLAAGKWSGAWIDPRTAGATGESFDHAGGVKELTTPEIQEDMALRLVRGGK